MNGLAATSGGGATCFAAASAGVAITLALTISGIPWPPDLATTKQHIQASHGGADSASRPATEVRPMACNALTNLPGKSVVTAIVHFPPNAYTAAHRHPGSVVAVVLSGTIRSRLDNGPIGTYTVHQTWYEPSGVLHNFVENASATVPADLLATFIVDENCGPLVIPEP